MWHQPGLGRGFASGTHRSAVHRGGVGTCELLCGGSLGAAGLLRLMKLQQKVCGKEEGMDESPHLWRAGAHIHPISHR